MTEIDKKTFRVRQTRIINNPGSAAHGLRMRVEDKVVPIVSVSDASGTDPETTNPLAETLKEINVRLSRRASRIIPYSPPRR